MSQERLVRSKRPAIIPMSTSSSIINRSVFDENEVDADKRVSNNNNGSRKFERTTSYDNWAISYEWDFLDMGYRLQEVATTLLLENIVDKRSTDCHIIDIGCGTGFVGRSLRKSGFKGVIHGIDENESMLRNAERKNAYDDLFWQHLTPDEKIDVHDDVKYDGLACIASFGVEHIHPKMLPMFLDKIKAKGVIVITAANHPRVETDKELLEREIEKLVESDVMQEVSEATEHYFTRGVSSRATENAATCQVYCFVKT